MKNNAGSFEGREGRKIIYQSWAPDSGEIKALIFALHGIGAHSDRLKSLAEFLTEKGYAIYAFDIRGHWRNAGEVPGHIDSIDHVVKDIVLFMDVLKIIAGNKKIFFAGISLGGLILLSYTINRADLAGVILASPLLGFSMKVPASKTLLKLAPNKTAAFEIDQKLLTSDLKVLKIFNSDKNKTSVMSGKTYSEIERSMKSALDNARLLVCPALIQQAGSDRIADRAKTKKFFEKVNAEDKTYKEYDGLMHDIWNEKTREQVFTDVFVWLEKHIK